jgi:hypothetical protein
MTVPDTAELAEAFALRRCACGAPAVSVAPGSLAVVEIGIMLRGPTPDRGFCLQCVGGQRDGVTTQATPSA